MFLAATSPKAIIDIHEVLSPSPIPDFAHPCQPLLLVCYLIGGETQAFILEEGKPLVGLLMSGWGCYNFSFSVIISHGRIRWIPVNILRSRNTPSCLHYLATILDVHDNQINYTSSIKDACLYLRVLQHKEPKWAGSCHSCRFCETLTVSLTRSDFLPPTPISNQDLESNRA